jgi:hypothetical protein
MKDIHKMRLGVLKELKNVHRHLENMERNIKTRCPSAIQRSYMFLTHLRYEMDKGCLNPDSIALDIELAQIMQEECPDLE